MMRPSLCIATARAFGGRLEDALGCAVSLELLHNALLIHDDTNPRSLVSAVDRLDRHAVEGEWPVGLELAAQAREALQLPLPELLPAARRVIEEVGTRVIERWFSSPVSPVLLRPTEVEVS